MAGTEHAKPQIDKFRDLAHELEADDVEACVDEGLKRLPNATAWFGGLTAPPTAGTPRAL